MNWICYLYVVTILVSNNAFCLEDYFVQCEQSSSSFLLGRVCLAYAFASFFIFNLFMCQRLARCSLIPFPLPRSTGLHFPALFAIQLGPPKEYGQKWCMALLGLATISYMIFCVLSPLFTCLEAKNSKVIELGLKDPRFQYHWLKEWQPEEQPDLMGSYVSKK